jgi:deoxyribose-phosphate aldolase
MAFQGETSLTNPDTFAAKLPSMIDHTLLKADASEAEIRKVCQEARSHSFATVCVNSSRIALVAELLRGSKSLPIAVVGFPLGAASTASKAFESQQAIADGAREIDMVVNLGALKDQNYDYVEKDIRAVVEASKPYPVKVILETSFLDHAQKIKVCELAMKAQAAFVKTSTGFGGGGATVEDIQLMRKIVGDKLGVKASGGVRTFEDAQKMIQAGANRIGASSSVDIVTKHGGTQQGY